MANKTVINITIKNLYVRGGADALETLTGSAKASNTDATAGSNAGRTATEIAKQVRGNTLAFLGSDPRYALRTKAAIYKALGAELDSEKGIVDGEVTKLVAEGKVHAKRRRPDGIALYGLADTVTNNATPTDELVPGHSDTPVTDSDDGAATPPDELSYDAIKAFITSDPRYTQRTMKAIVKNFINEFDEDEIEGVVNDMVDDDELVLRTRRRDSETLYAVV